METFVENTDPVVGDWMIIVSSLRSMQFLIVQLKAVAVVRTKDIAVPIT
jgi:hypothetical protein